MHAVRAFLAARPRDVERILSTRERLGDVAGLARAVGVPCESSGERVLERLAEGVPHQGVVALGRPPKSLTLEEALQSRPPLVLILDGITDPRNAGALLRSAEAFGAGAVVLASDRAPRLGPALIKAAAGAVEWLKLVRVVNLGRALRAMDHAGYWLLGLDPDGESELWQAGAIPGFPAALLVGAEDRGIRPTLKRDCHRLLRIPLAGRTESLNVAAATAIGLAELRRLLALQERDRQP
jgi:23S rRNA (guanosine2251-2'-O)-methyltransferase